MYAFCNEHGSDTEADEEVKKMFETASESPRSWDEQSPKVEKSNGANGLPVAEVLRVLKRVEELLSHQKKVSEQQAHDPKRLLTAKELLAIPRVKSKQEVLASQELMNEQEVLDPQRVMTVKELLAIPRVKSKQQEALASQGLMNEHEVLSPKRMTSRRKVVDPKRMMSQLKVVNPQRRMSHQKDVDPHRMTSRQEVLSFQRMTNPSKTRENLNRRLVMVRLHSL